MHVGTPEALAQAEECLQERRGLSSSGKGVAVAPRIYTVAAGTPFLTAVARALLAGDLPAPGGKRVCSAGAGRGHAAAADAAGDARAAGGVPARLQRRGRSAAEAEGAGGGLGRPRPDRRRRGLHGRRRGRRAARDQHAGSPSGPHRAGAAVGGGAARDVRARWRHRRLCGGGCGHAGAGRAARQGAGAADGYAGGGERQPGAPGRAGARGLLRALGAHAGVPAHRHAVLAGASRRAAALPRRSSIATGCCAPRWRG